MVGDEDPPVKNTEGEAHSPINSDKSNSTGINDVNVNANQFTQNNYQIEQLDDLS